MSKLYTQIRQLKTVCVDKQHFSINRKKNIIPFLTIALLIVQFASAQISSNFDFENSMQGWTTVGYGEFAQTNTSACGSGKSIRANVYYNSTNNLISPSVGTATGSPITMNFDYKVLNYSDFGAALGVAVDIKAQWSNSADGPWIGFYGLNIVTHVPSDSCATKTATFTPSAGPLFVRIQSMAVGSNTDLYYYYDNINFSEGGSATCAPPTSIIIDPATVTSSGFSLSWIAPNDEPAQGYQYEIRTSGVAGSGPEGLAATGATSEGITMAEVTGLNPNTSYTIFVRSKCSSVDFSSWSSSTPRTTLCISTNIPYAMPLSDTALPELPNCVTLENVNTDDRYWKTVASTAGMSGNVLQYSYNYAMAADDWFFTPTLNFDAGTSYRIAFKYKVSAYQEKLKVAIGSLPASNAMSTTLLDLTIPSTTLGALQQYIDFTVPTSGEYSIGFQAHSNPNSNILYIGEVSVDFGPTCIPPTAPLASNVGKTSATLLWTAATIFPVNGYVYEIRTSGTAGSGPVGLTTTGEVPAGTTVLNIENLDPETDYRLYIASRCVDQDRSTWTVAVRIKTLCDYLELQPIGDAICPGLPATLQVAGGDADVNWYLSQESSESIHTGNTYTTPQLQQTTSYFAESKIYEEDQVVKIGSGDQVALGYQNPFYSVWSNNHTQHILLAQELRMQDMIPGLLKSVALTITNAGTLPMIGLTIKIGGTSAPQLSEFIDNATFSTVFTAPSYMPVLGTNVFQFSEPFYWDGISNIVLEFCHGNPNLSPTMSRGVLADDTEYISSIKANFFTATEATDVCANTINNLTTYNIRPVFIFSAAISCQNPQRTEVVAVVNQVPPITAEATQILSVDILEDATLANLEPTGSDILWFSTFEDALQNINQLPLDTQLQTNSTYYAVRFENDCYSTPFGVTVSVQLGVKSINLESLNLYPNPVSEKMTISYSQEISNVKVFNMLGQEVLKVSPNNTEVTINMTSLSSGTYLIHINTIDASITKKVFKK